MTSNFMQNIRTTDEPILRKYLLTGVHTKGGEFIGLFGLSAGRQKDLLPFFIYIKVSGIALKLQCSLSLNKLQKAMNKQRNHEVKEFF